MVIYEVSLKVEAAVADDFRTWLAEHVQDMLRQPGFTGAQGFERQDGDGLELVVHYQVKDRAALEHYFQHGAAQMRGDGLRRFGDRFQASRRILVPLE
ncbi:DUF4286 family protein [Gallaecimonas sp. GXIMD4217]|uniref:DUF4286 family protein n=1 Tax=Gallaecimonas sp. GXIMD4217 TaxID=3131927 RepID=UPI00311AF900